MSSVRDVIIVFSIVWGAWGAIPLTYVLVVRWRRNRRARKEREADLTYVGDGGMSTHMDINQTKVHHLFHSLWTKAVGTEKYDKNEWKQMGNYLYSLMDTPGSSRKIAETEQVVKPPTRFEREEVL